MSRTTVFISYSHDCDAHRKKVLALSERLREDGIETILDQYVNGSPPEGWPRWMLNGLDAAASVIVVCTETYYCRFRGHEEPGKGKGVDWEGALITQEIYNSRSRTLKFVPVFLGTADEKWIPDPLRSGTHYPLISESAYRGLYDFLLGQSGVEAGPVGPLKLKPRRKGAPLTFDEPPEAETPKIDIFHFDVHKYAPADLICREAKTKVLADAWDRAVRGEPGRPHVLTFVALGGEGKTSLVAKWAAELAHQGWPRCDAVFAWSFYSSAAPGGPPGRGGGALPRGRADAGRSPVRLPAALFLAGLPILRPALDRGGACRVAGDLQRRSATAGQWQRSQGDATGRLRARGEDAQMGDRQTRPP
jgi:SEFIR domain-containing protein